MTTKFKMLSFAVLSVFATSFTPTMAAEAAPVVSSAGTGFSVYDSTIYGSLFTTPEMQAVYNDQKLIEYWLAFEVAMARAQADYGVIPKSAAENIAKVAKVENVDLQALRKATRKVGRPIGGLVKQIRALHPDAKKYLHLGSTTQDVMDSATVLQMQDAINVTGRQLDKILAQLADLAEKYADTPMVARTNGQDALPTTLGMMLSSYMMELNRNRDRLEAAKERAGVIQFGSAVGTLSSAGKDGFKIRKATAKYLGLDEPDMSWNASRDNYAEVVNVLALINGTLGRIAGDINLWSRTSDNSINEGEGGPSSTMPQKRNPRASEFMGGLAAMARIRAAGSMEMLMQSEVRQGAPWISEWSTIPEMFMITSANLDRGSKMFAKLIVRPDVMLERFEDSGHFVMAEAVQQYLVPKIGLGPAHSKLTAAIKKAPKGATMEDVISGDPELRKLISKDDMAKILDPKLYLGLAPELVKEAVEEVRDNLKEQVW